METTSNLDFIYKLIYGNQNSILPEQVSKVEYKNLNLSLKTVTLNSSPLFEINFVKPLPEIRKYYSSLIKNSIFSELNEIEQQIRKETDLERFHTIDQYIPRKINALLSDLNILLISKDLKLIYLLDKETYSGFSALKFDEIYVMQSLKYHLIFLYNEIQLKYSEYLEEDYLTLNEINDTFFSEAYNPDYITQLIVKGIEGIKETKTIRTEITSTNEESFYYIHFDSKNDNLNDLCDNLKKNNFIRNDTKLTDFKKVFSGKKSQNQIIWTGNQSDLSYFIKLIHNDKKLVRDLKQRQWEVTLKCFVQENEIPFDRDKLRLAQKPKRTAHLLEQAVNLF